MIFAGAGLGRSTPITRGARTIELLSSRISTASMTEKRELLTDIEVASGGPSLSARDVSDDREDVADPMDDLRECKPGVSGGNSISVKGFSNALYARERRLTILDFLL